MMSKAGLVTILVWAIGASTLAAGPPADKPKAPAGKEAAEKPKPAAQKVTVGSVSGRAQWFHPNRKDKKWVALKVGDVLDELAVVRTGFNTTVVLKFADRGSVTINSVTKIGIAEFRKKGKVVSARLGLKYGTFRAKIDSRAGPSDWRVKTPTATLSVRGSDMEGGFTPHGGPKGYSHQSPITMTTPYTTQTVNQGESVTSTPAPPIQLTLRTFVPYLGDSSAGSGPVEKKTYTEYSGGKAVTGGAVPSMNNPSDPIPVSPIVRREPEPEQDDEPGYP